MSQFGASLTDDPRVIICNCNMFIIPGTVVDVTKLFYLSPTLRQNKLECLPTASFIFASLMFVTKAKRTNVVGHSILGLDIIIGLCLQVRSESFCGKAPGCTRKC
jgi:hypothetical protein